MYRSGLCNRHLARKIAGHDLGLVVAVDPQDAVTLKYFVDAGANVNLGPAG
jgi:hypothetical protein